MKADFRKIRQDRREALREAKEATEELRTILRGKGAKRQDAISREEFILRRNKYGSRAYAFVRTAEPVRGRAIDLFSAKRK